MDQYYPIMLNIKNRRCGVVGGGKVAYRKILSLLECEAEVIVISKEIIQDIKILVEKNKIVYIEGSYDFKYISNLYLVYAATDEFHTNVEIYNQCNENHILVNVVDKPDVCNFIVPSKVKRGDLTIAISTNGKSPMLARKIREDLEKVYDDRYEIFLDIMGNVRKEAFNILKDTKKRSEFFRDIIYSDFIIRVSRDNRELIEEEIMDILIKYK